MRRIAGSFLILLLATPALAQETGALAQQSGQHQRELVDRVVAVVGDTVLLLSDVQAELQQMQAAGRPLPEDEAARAQLVGQLVDSRVNDLILLTAAKAAGIQVRDDEVSATVDQQVRAAQAQFRSEAEFRQALAASGMTLEQYRQVIGHQYRSQALTQRFLQQQLANAPRPPVSDAEIREMYESQRGMLGPRPATVSFQQILLPVSPSAEAMAEARRRAQQVLDELREGASFEVLARRYSEDPGSREQGGDLGWFRRGRMVPAFENVVWALRPGQTSSIVETEFGFHIIRVERTRGAERQARHILIRPEVTDEDMQRAWERGDSIASAAREGTPFAELVRRYPTPGENRVERVPLDRLPPVYGDVLAEARPGDVVGPFEEQGPTGARWIVVYVTERGDAGDWSLDDVRDQIRERIQEQMMVEQLVSELRRSTYVNILL